MGSPSEEPGPEIGLAGARFGGASRRRRPRSERRQAPAAAAPAASPVGLTGARFGGTRRRGADASPPPAPVVEPAPPALRPPAPSPEPVGPPEPSPYVTVRPYVLTSGRTRSRVELPLEALVSARPGRGPVAESGEEARIRELCRTPRSVAEIAALTRVPLGVARVLLGDLAAAGALVVHRTVDAAGPDLVLMERVLAGLRRL